MSNKLAPGQITRGMTEYVFCCWVCNWREVIHAFTKDDAIKLARQAGWFMEFGKWRCVSHNKNERLLTIVIKEEQQGHRKG